MVGRLFLGWAMVLGACAVFGTGCGSHTSLPDALAPSPAIAALNAAGTSGRHLGRGVYYVSFRPDLSRVEYFSLSDRQGRWRGTATIELGDCAVATFGEKIVFDHQRRLDIFPPCPGGAGVFQIQAGTTGRIKPLRKIVTRFPKTAWLVGDVSPSGKVAVGYSADAATHTSSSDILVYGSSAVGHARPYEVVPMYTRGCSEAELRKGPGQLPGSPSELVFMNDAVLLAQVGPTDSEPCGHEYLERFSVESTRLSSWLVPGKLAAAGGRNEPISPTPGFFTTGEDGSLTYGAYVGSSPSNGRNGGVTYGPDASGFQPTPQRVFTDALSGLGGMREARPTIAIGTDHHGNVYLQNGPGGSVIAIFGPTQSGNVKPLRTVHLPASVVGWPGALVEIL